MQRSFQVLAVLGLLVVGAPCLRAQSELQQALKDTNLARHWIYDDLPKGIEQARSTGKPLLVVFRCVPCFAGRSLDQKVGRGLKELDDLEKQFVCVRVVQMKGLDLKLLQFDYDQSWCALFLHADGTIYGRYGTRDEHGPRSDKYLSVPSFKKAMERVLELHGEYPKNKGDLAGKVGSEPEYKVAERIPGLQDRARGSVTKQNCIHCHMIQENILRSRWEEKKLEPADLWVHPYPDNIGLKMDIQDGLVVKEVAPDSPADRAGIKEGDVLAKLNGQPLISIADIQWVLHTVPVQTEIKATLTRDGKTLEKAIVLAGKWKQTDLAWRASSWKGLRHGLSLDPLNANQKRQKGIEADAMALVVKGLFGPGGQALKKSGIRQGDIILAINGKQWSSQTELLVHLRLHHGPDDKVKLTLLRDGKRQELTVTMW